MNRTIFNTPFVTPLLRGLIRISFWLTGWRLQGNLPDLSKYVVVGAPHTSNWDFVIFLGIILCLRGELRFMGKAELFRPPLGGFFRWCGGYPVERSKSQGMVEQMAEAFRTNEKFVLAIAPEGTRSKVAEWKTGFYHIAKLAGVPIATGFIDGSVKSCGIGPTFYLTDDMEADIKSIQSFYAGKVGIHPHKTSEL